MCESWVCLSRPYNTATATVAASSCCLHVKHTNFSSRFFVLFHGTQQSFHQSKPISKYHGTQPQFPRGAPPSTPFSTDNTLTQKLDGRFWLAEACFPNSMQPSEGQIVGCRGGCRNMQNGTDGASENAEGCPVFGVCVGRSQRLRLPYGRLDVVGVAGKAARAA